MLKSMIKSKKIFDVVAILFGIAAICMIFLPAIGITAGDETSPYSGTQVIFGYVQESGSGILSIKLEIFKFSFLNLLPYILLLVGVVALVLSVFGKGGKIINLVAVACFVVAIPLLLNAINFAVAGENEIATVVIKSWKTEQLSLLAGPIVASILAGLGAVAGAVKVVLKEKSK